jgi:hypothetical protein
VSQGARPAGEFLHYAAAEGQVRVSVHFEGKSYKTNQGVARLTGKDEE